MRLADSCSNSARSTQRLSRIHRWFGIGSIAFVVLLSVTGIALNHTDDLGLDRQFLSSSWLLDWYGVEVPPPQASFGVAGHRVSLIGERLYYDDGELTSGVSELVGAVSTPSFIAIATPSDVLLVMPDGALVERIDAESSLPNEISGIGVSGARLVLRSGGELLETDEYLLAFTPCFELDLADVQWSIPSAIPRDQLAVLRQLYRGRGISLERVLLDLHSGKFLTRAGSILLDVVGVLLIALSFLGIFMWFGRSGG